MRSTHSPSHHLLPGNSDKGDFILTRDVVLLTHQSQFAVSVLYLLLIDTQTVDKYIFLIHRTEIKGHVGGVKLLTQQYHMIVLVGRQPDRIEPPHYSHNQNEYYRLREPSSSEAGTPQTPENIS